MITQDCGIEVHEEFYQGEISHKAVNFAYLPKLPLLSFLPFDLRISFLFVKTLRVRDNKQVSPNRGNRMF